MEPRILVTLGPASLTEEVVSKCSALGTYLFRINLSHTPIELLAETIQKIQSWTDVPICLDSEGAQLRNHEMDGGTVYFEAGRRVQIYSRRVCGNIEQLSFTPLNMMKYFEPGDRIKIDFNGAELKIVEKNSLECVAIVANPGNVGSNKAADISRNLPFDPITPKDTEAIKIGLRHKINIFALSFANRATDVRQMRSLCGNDSKIICKIECIDGVKNLKEILKETDEILVDRGDLSRQVELHKIPMLQRLIISTANKAGKPVYVATNLLEAMTTNKSPTRAEVNDVVSTLMMGANGLVLAAETAIGNYPTEAVKMTRLLIDEVAEWNPSMTIKALLNY